MFDLVNSELQERKSYMDNQGIRQLCCEPTLEPSHRDCPNEGSQHKFI